MRHFSMMGGCVLALTAVALLPFSSAAPLQWEQVQPVGEGPTARYSHGSSTCDAMQGAFFIFGGEDGSTLYSDTWFFDPSSAGWEEVQFVAPRLPGQCAIDTAPVLVPQARAGHSMASTGNLTVMCGGYTFRNSSTKIYAKSADPVVANVPGGAIDCWWLIPTPEPMWKKFKYAINGSTPIPSPREGFALEWDSMERSLLIFGGLNSTGGMLNDCFYLEVPEWDLDAPDKAHIWRSCRPADEGVVAATEPAPRYGHGSSFFTGAGDESMYIFGGFANNGVGVVAQPDMWKLTTHHVATDARWIEINPVSTGPSARGFHAFWRSGDKFVIHGGQGNEGTGRSSVLQDTWSYDLFTGVWKQYGSSDSIPVASNIAVAPLDASTAVAHGGIGASGGPTGGLFKFNIRSGWTSVLPAGQRPSRRAGHVAVLDDSTSRMLVSFGITTGPKLIGDSWILNLETLKWECLHGPGESCEGPLVPPPRGPGPLAFMTGINHGGR